MSTNPHPLDDLNTRVEALEADVRLLHLHSNDYRARIRALEDHATTPIGCVPPTVAAQRQPAVVKDSLTTQPPADLSLIDEMALAIGDELSLSPLTLRPEARRVVAVIVRRLRERSINGSAGITANSAGIAANWLAQEADQ